MLKPILHEVGFDRHGEILLKIYSNQQKPLKQQAKGANAFEVKGTVPRKSVRVFDLGWLVLV
jgi:hypothetical protein